MDEASRYRLLIDAIADYAIYMLDASGHVSSWNTGAKRFKGYEEAEILGQYFSRFYTEEDRATGLPAMALEISAREGRFESEGWRLRKDGTRFWCHVIIDPIISQDGLLLGYAKVTRDLSERRAAEEVIRRSEQQFRLLVQGVTDYAIFMLDPEGRISNWNAGAQRIKGYAPDEVIGKHFSMFYEPADQAAGEPDRGLAIALREGRFEKQGWRVKKDGARFLADVVIDAIHDDSGELIGFAKITRDVTEAMASQRALAQAKEALLQSQKMEALGQLTGGVAHDFNNLLMVMQGCLDLVRKRTPSDPRVTPLLDNAIQAANRGAALTRRMLAFARRQELTLEPVDVVALVRGMSDLLQSSLGAQVQIETRFPLSVPLINADSNQLELAILNLAVNARDAMPDGGILAIEAREHRTGAPESLPLGHYLCLSLKDEGTGMDAATFARAVEPFFTTKGVGKGTGLGLSMVHGLAEQMGGKLVLRSSCPGGTTAEMWLPVVQQSMEVLIGTTNAESATHTEAVTVLLVEHDSLVLISTAAMLEDLGYVVVSANSADHALKLLNLQQVDVMIASASLPGTNGGDLAARAISLQKNIKVLLMTAYSDESAHSATSFAVLSKPFDQVALAQALRDRKL
ncbi:MAG: PAS domain S-box protein [Janthinobacterium lividum]